MKVVTSIFVGLLLILPLDFIFFIGLKKHYFDFHEMNLFFNIYFFDNQPFLLLLLISLVFGYLLLYTKMRRILQWTYLVILFITLFALHEPIGNFLGETIFRKNGFLCAVGKEEFKADLLYKGRKNYFLKREGIEKTIKIPLDLLEIKE